MTPPTTLKLATIEELRADAAIRPLLGSIACGFPSPAGDYEEKDLDLVNLLIPRPSSTFFAWAKGESMVHKGILSGALLVIDTSLDAKHGDVVAAIVAGEMSCKVLDKRKQCLRDAGDEVIEIRGDSIELFGVVTNAVNRLCKR